MDTDPEIRKVAAFMLGKLRLHRYANQHRYAEAQPLVERALGIWEKTLGPQHPEMATALINLAAIYHAQQRYAAAEPLYRRALAIMEKNQPTQSSALAAGLKTFASMLRHMKRKGEAVVLEAQAKAISQGRAGFVANSKTINLAAISPL